MKLVTNQTFRTFKSSFQASPIKIWKTLSKNHSDEVILRICKMCNATSDNLKNYEEHEIEFQRNGIWNQRSVDLNAVENI
jgi:hypothetical protein